MTGSESLSPRLPQGATTWPFNVEPSIERGLGLEQAALQQFGNLHSYVAQTQVEQTWACEDLEGEERSRPVYVKEGKLEKRGQV